MELFNEAVACDDLLGIRQSGLIEKVINRRRISPIIEIRGGQFKHRSDKNRSRYCANFAH